MTFAQQNDHLKWLEISSDGSVSFSGDLSEGYAINDISWAWSSAVACFPQNQSRKFTRYIKDILALANPYQVMIGVVGAEGLITGKYKLFIKQKK